MKREKKEATSAIVKLSQKYGLDEVKLVETLRATVIRPKRIRGRDGKPDSFVPASEAEVNAFLAVAAQYDLDPLLKQIHAFVSDRGGGIVPIVGYDGWVRLVNRERRFAGFETVDHLDEQNNLYAITGKMHVWNSHDGTPDEGKYTVEVTEYLAECRMDTEPWKKWPRRMLRNKVYNQTARMAFGLSGLYDEDEGARIEALEDAIDITPTKIPQAISGVGRTGSAPGSSGPPSGETERGAAEVGKDSPPPQSAPQAQREGGQETRSPGQEGKDTPPPTGAQAQPGKDAPRTDVEKRKYIEEVAEKAAKQFNVPSNQVVYDLSKFNSTKAGEEGKEVGTDNVETLSGRWLNKTYGNAKKMEEELNVPF